MPAPPSGATILVVEDDPDTQATLTELLEAEGYHVIGTGNGQEALDYLRNNPPPCLILLDMVLPVMDGWEFREQQKRDPAIAAIPVVIVTAGAAPQRQTRSIDAAAYFLKPVDTETLLDTVARHCRPVPG